MKIAVYFEPKREGFDGKGKLIRVEGDIRPNELVDRGVRIVNLICTNYERWGIFPYQVVMNEDPRVFKMACEELEMYANAVDELAVVPIEGQHWGAGYK